MNSLEVVVNAEVSIDSLTAKQLRRIYTMRQISWADGTPITVFILPHKNDTHKNFSKEYLHIFPYQLERIWDRLVFSGLGVGPVMVNSEKTLLTKVASIPGAIGYVRNFKGSDDVVVISIDE